MKKLMTGITLAGVILLSGCGTKSGEELIQGDWSEGTEQELSYSFEDGKVVRYLGDNETEVWDYTVKETKNDKYKLSMESEDDEVGVDSLIWFSKDGSKMYEKFDEESENTQVFIKQEK